MNSKRKEEILNEVLFWAMEVINNDEEFYYTALHSWGLTPEECKELDITATTEE